MLCTYATYENDSCLLSQTRESSEHLDARPAAPAEAEGEATDDQFRLCDTYVLRNRTSLVSLAPCLARLIRTLPVLQPTPRGGFGSTPSLTRPWCIWCFVPRAAGVATARRRVRLHPARRLCRFPGVHATQDRDGGGGGLERAVPDGGLAQSALNSSWWPPLALRPFSAASHPSVASGSRCP